MSLRRLKQEIVEELKKEIYSIIEEALAEESAHPNWLKAALNELEEDEGMVADDVKVSPNEDWAWIMFDNFKDWTLFKDKKTMDKLIKGKRMHGNKIMTEIGDGVQMAEVDMYMQS